MLFNSIDFGIFLPIVFTLYWFVTNKDLRLQNKLLFISGYIFYAWWDYRFLFLLIFSTCIGFFIGIKIYDSQKTSIKKRWVWIGISTHLVLLGFFKYYNFLVDSFTDAFSFLGIAINTISVSVILPVGISFYTFHGISYILDVYKGKTKPVQNFIDYAVFVSFFPLLVAGPIERAGHLLPQIQRRREFDYSKSIDGLRQILWGLFKKIVVADSCAEYVNMVFNNVSGYSSSTLAFGVIFFSFQIYCDFSGYSDIAIGTAKLFGIELLQNFSFPYFSRSIPEFWRRWHISLSSWFRDYVFFPLERQRVKYIGQPLNILTVFFLTGLWHGANWTFIVWGLLHGFYLILSAVFGRFSISKRFPYLSRWLIVFSFFEVLSTFLLVSFTWIFFRAQDVRQAITYITLLFSRSIINAPELQSKVRSIIVFIGILLVFEWHGRNQQYALAQLGHNWPRLLRWGIYYIIVFVIFYYAGSEQQFIYFQF